MALQLRFAEACLDAGEVGRATEFVQHVIATPRPRGQRGWEARGHAGLGRLASGTGDRARAEASFAAAIALYRDMGMRTLAARTEAEAVSG